jgi:hypothetical protein
MDRNEDSNGGHTMSGVSNANGTAADRLRQAVGAAAAGNGSRTELETAARALVAELRDRDAPPEQMLIQMKQLLADAGLHAGFPGADADDSHRDHGTLYREIITWSIRCYYEDGKSDGKDAP